MLAFLRHIDEHYGGFATYLADGVGGSHGIRTLTKRMVVDEGSTLHGAEGS